MMLLGTLTVMLYTFSKSEYDTETLSRYVEHCSSQDCIVLWQDGVLLPLKYPDLFSRLTACCYALEVDLNARNLTEIFLNCGNKVQSISLTDFIEITEKYFPQISL